MSAKKSTTLIDRVPEQQRTEPTHVPDLVAQAVADLLPSETDPVRQEAVEQIAAPHDATTEPEEPEDPEPDVASKPDPDLEPAPDPDPEPDSDPDPETDPEPDPETDPVEYVESSLGHPVAEDPDTSMVESLILHLISEHNLPHALMYSDDEAERRHAELHLGEEQDHPVDDHRFRVLRAMATIKLADQRHDAMQRLVSPVPAPLLP